MTHACPLPLPPSAVCPMSHVCTSAPLSTVRVNNIYILEIVDIDYIKLMLVSIFHLPSRRVRMSYSSACLRQVSACLCPVWRGSCRVSFTMLTQHSTSSTSRASQAVGRLSQIFLF
jgi:hypothetical protein